MTFSYDITDLATSPKDAVRLLIHDTDAADPLLQDEEINYLVAVEGTNLYRIAWRAAEVIAAKFARVVDRSIGPLNDRGSQKQAQYAALACDLRNKMLRSGPVPLATALSISEKQSVEDQPDRVPNIFRREEFIYPGTEGAVLNEAETGVPSA